MPKMKKSKTKIKDNVVPFNKPKVDKKAEEEENLRQNEQDRLNTILREKCNEVMKIIDVSQNSVTEVISKYNVKTLIHGHTHRQGIHKLTTNGLSAKRIVLGDWYERDSILIYDKKDFRFERVEDYIAGN